MSAHRLSEPGVRALYRELLGRDIESAEVLNNHLKGHPTVESLRHSILQSEEYLAKHPRPDLWRFLSTNLARPSPKIDVDVTADQLETIFQRVASQWVALGDTEPHWSVLTNDKYRQSTFTNHEEEFYQSGTHVASLVKTFAMRNGTGMAADHVLELGCGTGRVTAALAKMFARVTAIDVSPGHLQLCREAMGKGRHSNIEYVLLRNPQDVASFPRCSFFLSTIVLQHNPPPLISYLLDWSLSKVEPGGAALFQVPTHTPGYEFQIDKYLSSSPPEDFEMHCLPMHRVFEVLNRHGFAPKEVVMDAWTGLPGSHTFFAVKS